MPVEYVVLNQGTPVLELWAGTISHDEVLAHKRWHLSDSSVARGASVLVDAISALFQTTLEALHEVTCETLEPCHICFIDRQAYLELIRRNSELAIRLIQLLSSELGIRMDQRDLFALRSGRERLAALLLELGGCFGQKAGKGTLIGIKLKREELADMAGIAVETAIRLLSAFRKEGLVSLDRRSITLLSRDRLVRVAKL